MPGHQTSRLSRRAATVLPLAASLVVALLGCAEANRISVSGNVDDDVVTVQAPHIEIAAPDLNAGFADTDAGNSDQQPTSNQDTTPGSPASAAASLSSWNRIASVEVQEGDQVQAGQELVRLDSQALQANLRIARADAQVAARQVPVLDSAIDKTYDKERSAKSALKKINKAIRQLKDNRATLSGQLAEARQQLPQLQAKRTQLLRQQQQLRDKLNQLNQQLTQLQKASTQLPPQPSSAPTPPVTPGSPNTEQLRSQITKLRQAKSQLQSGLKQLTGAEAKLTTGIARLRSGIPKLESAIRQLDTGLAKARSQRVRLHRAQTKIIDARAELHRTRKLAVIAADAAKVGIDLAENQTLLATVRATASGVVVEAPTVGAILPPGATVATIRTGDASSVTTWLSPVQLAEICLGSQAWISADWMTEQSLDATITLIGDRADYPPTRFATDEVHLTRAVPVRLTLARSSVQPQPLPPGAPVDIEILPAANDQSCSTATTGR